MTQISPDRATIDRAKKIKAVIFDVDGVLTDGGLYRSDDGQEIKRFNATDGLGMRMLADAGIELAIITGRESEVVKYRAQELKITHVIQGAREKLSAFETLCQQMSLPAEEFAFMGDDIIDLPVLRRVGLAMTVPQANAEVTEVAHWVSKRTGGNGAAREACEFLLKSKNLYDSAIERYTI